MAITFSVPGKPVPQPRPKVTRNGHAYTPDNGIVAYRAAIAAAARAAGATPTAAAPLTLIVDFVFTRPQSHFKASGELNARTALKVPPGDCSNYLKGVEDCLNGVAWVDDVQLGKVIAEKSYGAEARTTVRIG
jgi:Holliday junction resolvase RusA-like endonuclease